ncbi:16S rRNA (guanine(966)-N(2))-methyltransferase RsmD [Motiliproteus sp. MSK22-1]|uniref:16S rRNA (guanine(966)-N(2))-methyltransferase RsmD n=1 Tax=Motiliproteus sp. MSK22-1 TaxID=1897630 RepID=UPI00097765E0|nr:16S rRNA (guanine(966)-N(2))-methyltransferase RsmD [Motiliproteus sp. MSK22-1]OMH39662.1 16S rRNA (guanine(966)-N(2))-methyltransferase RsmD [Motiliproteus sp. MSK22-1]
MPRKQRRSPPQSTPKAGKGVNTLRIIAGHWRGRKLSFPDQEGLRPTPDRVRETLFNWLQPSIEGSRCLDLFSGSGALALEALSRGAASATLIDSSKLAIDQLRLNLNLLKAENVQLIQASAPAWLEQQTEESGTYDLVFLDPPFRQDMLEKCCQRLEQGALLKDQALIYIEVEKELKNLPLPENWQILRQKDSGQIRSCLCQRNSSDLT